MEVGGRLVLQFVDRRFQRDPVASAPGKNKNVLGLSSLKKNPRERQGVSGHDFSLAISLK
jgi:hypothetical protein